MGYYTYLRTEKVIVEDIIDDFIPTDPIFENKIEDRWKSGKGSPVERSEKSKMAAIFCLKLHFCP